MATMCHQFFSQFHDFFESPQSLLDFNALSPPHRAVYLFLLVLRTVLDQSCELDVVEVASVVTILLVEHLFDLFLRESFAHCLQESFQLLSWDHLCAFGVEAFEGVSDDVFGVGTVELLPM